MKHRPSALTSPAPCGAFICLSASPLNRAAQAPQLPRAAALPAALPLSSVRPPPRLGQADKPRPVRATAAGDQLNRRRPCPDWGGTVNPFAGTPPAAPPPPLSGALAPETMERRRNISE